MSVMQVLRYDDFTGGLNLRADQFQLERTESPDMLNVEIDPRGGVFSRGGMRRMNTTEVGETWTPQSLYPFYGASSRVMLSTATRVMLSSNGDFSLLNSALATPLVVTSPTGASFAQWGTTLYVSLGHASANMYRWATADTYATSLTASAVGAWQTATALVGGHMPKSKLNLLHANKMFVADTTEDGVRHPNRIRWSVEAQPEDWDADDYIDVNNGGSSIRAIAVVNGQLAIFKDYGVFVLLGYNSDNHQLSQVTDKLGVSQQQQVVSTSSGVYFFSYPHGLHFFDGSTVVDISQNLKTIFDLGYINPAYVSKITVSYIGRRVWVSVPYHRHEVGIATEAKMNFVYDSTIGKNGAFTQFETSDDYGVISGTNWTDDAGTDYRLMLHPVQGFALNVDRYSEVKDLIAGTEAAFDSYYRTGFIDAGNYAMKKMFRRPDFVFKQVDTASSINVKVYHNYEEALGNERRTFDVSLASSAQGARWGVGRWGVDPWGILAEGSQVSKGSNLGLARSIQLLLTGPEGLPWGMNSVSYKYNQRKVTG